MEMATKRICDRCGAEIYPFNSVTYAGVRRMRRGINDKDYELCVSCTRKLLMWFNMAEMKKGETENDQRT